MAAGSKAQAQISEARDDHQVIDPPETLTHAVDPNGSPHAGAEAVARAEKALNDLSEHFDGWMDSDLDALMAARDRARDAALSPDSKAALFNAAHDMKGQASTLGFPEAAEVASSLCRLLEGVTDPARIPGALIDQHVDGIRALVRERGREGYGTLAHDLVERLAGVTLDYVNQERERVGLPPAGLG